MKGTSFMDPYMCDEIGSNDCQTHAFTSSMEYDLFLPTGCYIGVDWNRVLFDSGCTMVVSLYKSDFVGCIKYVKGGEIQGISSITNVEGIGILE